MMQEQINTCEAQLGAGDLVAAQATLTELLSQFPQEATVQLLAGRFYYAKGEQIRAEDYFRQVLRSAAQPRLLAMARQGLQEITRDRHNAHQNRATVIASQDQGRGFLVLFPLDEAQRQAAAAKYARMFNLDAYTARYQLAARTPKILRAGKYAEIQAYAEEMTACGIPCAATSLTAVAAVPVYNVQYFQQISPTQFTGICTPDSPTSEITVTPSQILRRVLGTLPTFGQVLDFNGKLQIVRKQQILDRVRVCDFHVIGSGTTSQAQLMPDHPNSASANSPDYIIRIHDNGYEFDQGVKLPIKQALPHIPPTVQERWAALDSLVRQAIPNLPTIDSLPVFGEQLLVYEELLELIHPHLNLARLQPSFWDHAFHVYSTMIILGNWV
ncbi:MAG: hypothetical protein ACK456_15190 [Pseudanabaenaceae cyanobacterium]